MSFSLIRKTDPNLVDVRSNYKKIAEELMTQYYNLYDADFPSLARMYHPESQFTYRDNEFYGFPKLLSLIKDTYRVYKFTHSVVHLTVQPINRTDLLIMTHGLLSINNSTHSDKFIETLVIRRDDSNQFCIISTIFKLVE